MSEDRSREIVADYRERHLVVRLVENLEKHIPAPMNLGIKKRGARPTLTRVLEGRVLQRMRPDESCSIVARQLDSFANLSSGAS